MGHPSPCVPRILGSPLCCMILTNGAIVTVFLPSGMVSWTAMPSSVMLGYHPSPGDTPGCVPGVSSFVGDGGNGGSGTSVRSYTGRGSGDGVRTTGGVTGVSSGIISMIEGVGDTG